MLNPITRLFACSTLIWNVSLIASTLRVPTNLTCTPETVDSGSSATCTVTISRAASESGSHVHLSSNNPALKVPTSVTVNSGRTYVTFAAAAGTVQNNQTATVTATLNSGTQTATITLLSPVYVSVSPPTVSLAAGQTEQFTATVSGGSGVTAVTWGETPNLGNISNGLYTAPASLAGQQVVTVQATSVADSSKSATATVTLNPSSMVSVSLTPTTAALNDSQTQQFTANVNGTSNTALSWSLDPAVGTISSYGLYTAPALSGPGP